MVSGWCENIAVLVQRSHAWFQARRSHINLALAFSFMSVHGAQLGSVSHQTYEIVFWPTWQNCLAAMRPPHNNYAPFPSFPISALLWGKEWEIKKTRLSCSAAISISFLFRFYFLCFHLNYRRFPSTSTALSPIPTLSSRFWHKLHLYWSKSSIYKTQT